MNLASGRSLSPRMHAFFLTTLQLGAVAAILIGLFGQIVIIPGMAEDLVDRQPSLDRYSLPYVAAAIFGVACVQVALAAACVLLHLVRHDAIFTPQAFRWMDALIGCATAATVLACVVAGHVFFGDIPFPQDGMQYLDALGSALVCVGVGVLSTMLFVILRGLLVQVTALKSKAAGAM